MQLADVGETLNTPPTPNHPPCFCSQLRYHTTRWTRRLINEADRYRETQFGLLLISSCHNKLLLNTSWRDLHIVFSNINLSLNVPQSLVAVLYFTMLLLSKCHQNAGTQCLQSSASRRLHVWRKRQQFRLRVTNQNVNEHHAVREEVHRVWSGFYELSIMLLNVRKDTVLLFTCVRISNILFKNSPWKSRKQKDQSLDDKVLPQSSKKRKRWRWC